MQKEIQFHKQQFLQSKNWEYSKDLTNAVLDGRKKYTKEQAKKAVEAYLQKKQ